MRIHQSDVNSRCYYLDTRFLAPEKVNRREYKNDILPNFSPKLKIRTVDRLGKTSSVDINYPFALVYAANRKAVESGWDGTIGLAPGA